VSERQKPAESYLLAFVVRGQSLDGKGWFRVSCRLQTFRTIRAGMVRNTCPENVMFSIYKFTLLLGICCVLHSFCMFCYFLRSEKLAGKAIMWKLGAEFVGLSIYCVFAACELLGEMPTPYISTWMRAVVFVSALAASIHMVRAIQRIAQDEFE
jgi:hypothetical protein